MNLEEMENQVIEYMKEFDMLRKEDKQFRLMPIIFKIKARYPKEFKVADN